MSQSNDESDTVYYDACSNVSSIEEDFQPSNEEVPSWKEVLYRGETRWFSPYYRYMFTTMKDVEKFVDIMEDVGDEKLEKKQMDDLEKQRI